MKIILPKSILTILLLFTCTLTYSQMNADGIPFIKNYDLSLYKAGETNWSIAQDDQGVMYFGNSEVVLEYDGQNWEQIPVPGQDFIYSLATGSDGRVYVGGVDDFGIIDVAAGGKKVFKSLKDLVSDSIQVDRVWKIYFDESNVYFCTGKYIHKFSPARNVIESIKLNTKNFWTFMIDGVFYTSNYEQGLLVYKNQKFELVKGGEYFKGKDIFSLLKWSEDEFLIATHVDGLSIYNIKTGEVSDINNRKTGQITSQLLKDAHVYKGIKLNGEYFAYATMHNGVFVINKLGEIVLHLNEKNGLLGNVATNVYYTGNQEGMLWTTLTSGISSINFGSPVREFSPLYGLEGSIYGLTEYDGNYYVGSMAGVYKMIEDNEKGVSFNKIKETDGHIIYSLVNYKTPDGKEILIVASTKGVYVIKNDRALPLDLKSEATVILPSKVNPNIIYVGTASDIRKLNYENGQIIADTVNKLGSKGYVLSIVEDKNGNLWSNTLSNRQSIGNNGESKDLPETIKDKDGKFFGLNGEVYFSSDEQIYKFNFDENDFEKYEPLSKLYIKKSIKLKNFYELTDTSGLIFYDKEQVLKSELLTYSNGEWIIDSTEYRIIPSMTINSAYQDDKYLLIGGQNGFFVVNNEKIKPKYDFNALIRTIQIDRDSLIYNGAMNYFQTESTESQNIIFANEPISYNLNNIAFTYSGVFFEREEDMVYRSWLEGFENQYSNWAPDIERTYTNLKEGTYKFRVKAKNIYGVESREAIFEFEILPPWYRTWWAYMIYLVIAFVIIRISISLYTRKLQEDKKRLEKIVEERTAEIVEKNERIEKQNIAITDSIKYAKRIQNAVLPDKQTSELFEYFIYFKPKDIVSGDFYWVSHLEKQNRLLVVAADCTGHGVPGAFMSMLGTSFLNEIVAKLDVVHAEDVLNLLRENVITTLSQGIKSEEEEKQKDGMDMALASIDLKTLTLEYSGANNPLVLIRDGELIEYKPDKMPIGAYVKQHIPFTRKEIELKKNDIFYIFSDGYVDQFGGPRGRKYMKKRFKEYLFSIHEKPMAEQRQLLSEEMLKWMDGQEQIDDQIVIGMRLIK